MNVIALASMKGGTGKTTAAFNIGSILAEKNKVLLIDTDWQAVLTHLVGLDASSTERKTIRDVFETPESIHPNDVITASPIRQLPNLDVIGSDMNLSLTDAKFHRIEDKTILRRWIEQNQDELSKYSYIIIDAPPGMAFVTQNAYLAADSMVLVSDMSQHALLGAQTFAAFWDKSCNEYGKENNVKALILNKFISFEDGVASDLDEEADQKIIEARRRNEVACRKMEESYREDKALGQIVLQHALPYDISLFASLENNLPVNLAAPKSSACEAIRAVVHELEEMGVLAEKQPLNLKIRCAEGKVMQAVSETDKIHQEVEH